MTAIEDDGGTKTATNGALSDRILCNLLARRWIAFLCLVLEPPSLVKWIQKWPTTYMPLYTMLINTLLI